MIANITTVENKIKERIQLQNDAKNQTQIVQARAFDLDADDTPNHSVIDVSKNIFDEDLLSKLPGVASPKVCN